MTYFAGENCVTTQPFAGGIAISEEQYQQAIAAICSGQIVTVADGFAIIDPPSFANPTPPEPLDIPTLSREAFCVALVGVGIFTEAEAESAAMGTWPAKFEPALAGKAFVQKLTIKNLWRETKTVARNAPLFLDLLGFYATAEGLNTAQAQALGDKIFAQPAP